MEIDNAPVEQAEARAAVGAGVVAISRDALTRIRTSMVLLQQNSEGCAQNHYGEDFDMYGMPGWLIDTAGDVAALTEALSASLTEASGSEGPGDYDDKCLTPECSYRVEIKTHYAHSSYGNARVGITAFFPEWQSLKINSHDDLKRVELILHHYMQRAVAEIGRLDVSLGGDLAKHWPAVPTRLALNGQEGG